MESKKNIIFFTALIGVFCSFGLFILKLVKSEKKIEPKKNYTVYTASLIQFFNSQNHKKIKKTDEKENIIVTKEGEKITFSDDVDDKILLKEAKEIKKIFEKANSVEVYVLTEREKIFFQKHGIYPHKYNKKSR